MKLVTSCLLARSRRARTEFFEWCAHRSSLARIVRPARRDEVISTVPVELVTEELARLFKILWPWLRSHPIMRQPSFEISAIRLLKPLMLWNARILVRLGQADTGKSARHTRVELSEERSRFEGPARIVSQLQRLTQSTVCARVQLVGDPITAPPAIPPQFKRKRELSALQPEKQLLSRAIAQQHDAEYGTAVVVLEQCSVRRRLLHLSDEPGQPPTISHRRSI